MNYLTNNNPINTTAVTFATAKGTQISLTLVRNAKLGTNGWLESANHDMELTVNGNSFSYCGISDDADHGLVIMANMRKVLIPVPADHQDAIRAIVAEKDTNNDAVLAASLNSEANYQRHVAKIYNAMDA